MLNPDVYFCDGAVCAIGDSAKSYYRDHLNAHGTALMAPLLRALVDSSATCWHQRVAQHLARIFSPFFDKSQALLVIWKLR